MYSYLALGDSYTIGESVPLFENYAYQAVQIIRSEGIEIYGPEVIARTGWTTTDLQYTLKNTLLAGRYAFVSLLIGVNNQYRGLPPLLYHQEFNQLLETCISLTGRRAERVFVLSIPDWSLTPYARGKNSALIGDEIREYNRVNRKISEENKVNYVDITSDSPENGNDLSFLSGDGLHPSGKAYARWAALLSSGMLETIRQEDC